MLNLLWQGINNNNVFQIILKIIAENGNLKFRQLINIKYHTWSIKATDQMILNTPVLQIYNQILYGNPAEKKKYLFIFSKQKIQNLCIQTKFILKK